MVRRELYAFCYGRSLYGERFIFPGSDSEREVDFGWFFFAWRDEEGWGLIDTGFEDEEARERFGLSWHVPPRELLGVEVERVILTHAHFDHAGTCFRYPGARFVMARAELEAMRAALVDADWHAGYRRRELEVLERVELELLDGPAQRWGMELSVVGGHTPGMLSVRWSRDLVLAGDNAYLYTNVDRPGVVPGHDLQILERFEQVRPGVVRLA